MKRTAQAIWKGTGLEGTGTLSTQSGVFNKQPYSFKLRFENEDGQQGTNPEELIAAAHAGCFAMALSFGLKANDYVADELNTRAELSFDKVGEGFAITKITLILDAKIPNISKEKFLALAEGAKENCPVSGVLKCEIDLKANLV